MYGIAGPSYDNGQGSAALVKYDIDTGNTTTQATTAFSPVLTGESLGCLDTKNSVYFFIYEGYNKERQLISGLYPYDLANPSNVYDPVYLPLIYPDPFVGAGDECTFDPDTGDIYVFGHDNDNLDYQLLLKVVFDASSNSADITMIGNYSLIDDIPLIAGETTIFDSKRKYLWVVGEFGNDTNNFTVDYFYINANTGAIENTVNFEDVIIDTALYDSKLDLVVGLKTGERTKTGHFPFQMVHVDPVTLETKQTFTAFDDDYCSWEAIYALDTMDGVYYQLLYKMPDNAPCASYNGTFLGHLTGVFVDNGTVRAAPQFCEFGDVLSCPWDFQWFTES
eukprot:CAMPEP_0114658242 /NCGR_PEP_ID=MMETSP0191-20121206/15372_1 /TAXON_ID=126664 /ORGANISM="Sorites sp." /LENGTH=335 /DNA_ID=CAMNT_0001879709 /DNA_START=202 /DNA_END=1209 /DNA_ORIENTATION=+